MIVSIHQPDYIPWLGFFYKVAHSDVFVYLDDAQFSNEAAHNYNDIKTPQGKLRLKIPVEYNFGDSICNIRTRDELNWKDKHLKTLQMNYSRAAYFKDIFPSYADVVKQNYENLAELNISINQFLFNGFGICPQVLRSSDMGLSTVREERVIDICLSVGGTEYLSGTGARSYQNEEHFLQRGLKLTYSNYAPIRYQQLWKDFLPCMSVLDYIFNCGFDWGYVERTVRESR